MINANQKNMSHNNFQSFDSPPVEPHIHYEGPIAFHTQRCAVLPEQHAVLDLSTGVFHPSWIAQDQGWRLVRADTFLQRLALRLFGYT